MPRARRVIAQMERHFALQMTHRGDRQLRAHAGSQPNPPPSFAVQIPGGIPHLGHSEWVREMDASKMQEQ